MEDSKLKYIIKWALWYGLFTGLLFNLFTTTYSRGTSTYWQEFLGNLWDLPLWLIGGAIIGVLTWTDNIIWVEKKREEQGLCKQCGYDIKNSGVDTCPECGTKNPKL